MSSGLGGDGDAELGMHKRAIFRHASILAHVCNIAANESKVLFNQGSKEARCCRAWLFLIYSVITLSTAVFSWPEILHL